MYCFVDMWIDIKCFNEEVSKMEEVKITSDTINLDQFLKWANIVISGGEAKHLIQTGEVFVNGEVELKRGKTLKAGDLITLAANDKKYKVIRDN